MDQGEVPGAEDRRLGDQNAVVGVGDRLKDQTPRARGAVDDGKIVIEFFQEFLDDRDPGAFADVHRSRMDGKGAAPAPPDRPDHPFRLRERLPGTQVGAEPAGMADLIENHQFAGDVGEGFIHARIDADPASVAFVHIHDGLEGGDLLFFNVGRLQEEVSVGLFDIAVEVSSFLRYSGQVHRNEGFARSAFAAENRYLHISSFVDPAGVDFVQLLKGMIEDFGDIVGDGKVHRFQHLDLRGGEHL